MRTIIASAEPYGFGPVSKLAAICRMLRNSGYMIHFVGSGTAFTYASVEPEAFDTATLGGANEMSRLLGETGSLIALSAMDPLLPLCARTRGVPSVYVDSLFWMWDWPDEEALDASWQREILHGDGDWENTLSRMSMPEAEYVGHRASTVSAVQRTPSTLDAADRPSSLLPVVETGAIVDTSRIASSPRSHWLVSLSGLTNPLVSTEQAVAWADATVKIFVDSVKRADLAGAPIHLTGNAQVLSHLETSPDVFFRPRTSGEVLELMNGALGCFTPPGLTTLFECAAYACAVIPGPPQHYAHETILREFADGDLRAFPNAFPLSDLGVSLSGDAKADTAKIQAAVAELHRNLSRDEMVDRVATQLSTLVREQSTQPVLGVVSQQRDAIDRYVGGFDGCEEVCAIIDSMWS